VFRSKLVASLIGCFLLAACTTGTEPSPTSRNTPAQAFVEIPDVTHMKLRQAEAALDGSDLELGKVKRRGDGSRGIVLEQSLTAGTQVAPSTKVDLTVSKVFPVPFLNIPRVGTFAWTCRREETIIRFTVDEGAASTRTSHVSRNGKRRSPTIHPGQSVETALNTAKAHRWTLIQSTKPLTRRAQVSITAQRPCASYLPPRTSLELRSRSHSVS
jgi:hypothetical protein